MELKDINNIYIHYLINQYLNSIATKIENVDLHSENFMLDFASWIKRNKAISESYKCFIDYMDVKPQHENNIVEVGKGKFDSIALYLGLPIITEFTYGMEPLSRNHVINKKLHISWKEPFFVDGTDFVNVFAYINNTSRFVTHNPYEPDIVKGWPQLHNQGHNITIGVFGNIHDKDKESKIKMLKDIKSQMSLKSLKDEYATDDDMYFYAVSSNRKVKKYGISYNIGR